MPLYRAQPGILGLSRGCAVCLLSIICCSHGAHPAPRWDCARQAPNAVPLMALCCAGLGCRLEEIGRKREINLLSDIKRLELMYAEKVRIGGGR